MFEFKKYKHNPPHLFVPEAKYFITSSTYQGKKLLKSNEAKYKLLEYIKNSLIHFNWKLEDWVILDNHYHIMVDANDKPMDLGKIMGNIHRYSAIWIKKNFKKFSSLERIWYNYWDSCITYEESYFARLNYIWFNPVKHSYVEDPEDWIHGSYFLRVKKEEEYLRVINKRYPFDKLRIFDDF